MRCVMPHSNLELHNNGEFGPCCLNPKRYVDQDGKPFNVLTHSIDEVWNSIDRKSYAGKLDDEMLSDCNMCWDLEALQSKSKRDIENNSEYRKIAIGPGGLDIKFSNTCNLRCTICGPMNSSQWYRDHEQLTGKKFDTSSYHWSRKIDVYEYLKASLKHVSVLELYGGEPLLFKDHLNLLRYCVDNDISHKQQLRMNTNGTIKITDEHLDVYSKFANVGINWSIDSFDPEQFEYLRFPGKFNEMQSNFEYVYNNRSPNIDMNVTCTVSIQNVYYLDKIAEYMSAYPDVALHFNILTHPTILSINNIAYNAAILIADHLDQSINAKYNGPDLHAIARMLRQSTSKNHSNFFSYIGKLDNLRGNNFDVVFPTANKILREHNE